MEGTILHPDDMARVVRESIAGEASLKAVRAGKQISTCGWRVALGSDPDRNPDGTRQVSISALLGLPTTSRLQKKREIELRGLNEVLERRVEERTAQLHTHEAHLRAILETTNQYQGLLALDGTLVFANAVALAAIAVEAKTVLGMPFWDTPWFDCDAPYARTSSQRV